MTLQFCLDWIISNVTSVVFKLLGAPDQMVILVDLPKLAFAPVSLVDLSAGVSFPFCTLFQEHDITVERNQKMGVIGHHDGVG